MPYYDPVAKKHVNKYTRTAKLRNQLPDAGQMVVLVAEIKHRLTNLQSDCCEECDCYDKINAQFEGIFSLLELL